MTQVSVSLSQGRTIEAQPRNSGNAGGAQAAHPRSRRHRSGCCLCCCLRPGSAAIQDQREVLRLALKSQDRSVRAEAARALSLYPQHRTSVALMSLLKDQDAYVRSVAVESLGKIKDAAAIGQLKAALKDENVSVQGQAALAWGRCRAPRRRGTDEPLERRRPYVRLSATRALGQIRAPEAVELLLPLLADTRSPLQGGACRCSGRNQEPPCNRAPYGGVRQGGPQRLCMVRSLRRIGGPRVIEALINVLKDRQDKILRASALSELGLAERGHRAPHCRVKDDSSPRLEIIVALERIGDRSRRGTNRCATSR